MRKNLHMIAIGIMAVFMAAGCADFSPLTPKDDVFYIELLDVEIEIDLANREIRVDNRNADIVHVLIGKRAAAGEYITSFDRRISKLSEVCDRSGLDYGDEIKVVVKVGGSSYDPYGGNTDGIYRVQFYRLGS